MVERAGPGGGGRAGEPPGGERGNGAAPPRPRPPAARASSAADPRIRVPATIGRAPHTAGSITMRCFAIARTCIASAAKTIERSAARRPWVLFRRQQAENSAEAYIIGGDGPLHRVGNFPAFRALQS